MAVSLFGFGLYPQGIAVAEYQLEIGKHTMEDINSAVYLDSQYIS